MMRARWIFEDAPAPSAVVIHLLWGRDGVPQATLRGPDAMFRIKEFAALSFQPMDVPSAFAAGVLLSLREKVRLRITGDRSAWAPEWGTLEDIGAHSRH
ncbi:MAG: hypothetical protein JWQ65_339 [Devosia sp.]|nr:hypothetical protein [Devosia sp.]